MHGNKAVFLKKRCKLLSSDELNNMEQLIEDPMQPERLAKDGTKRGLSPGSRAGAGNKASGAFTNGVRRNLQRCIDIFFMRAPEAGTIDQRTKKRKFIRAALVTLTIPGGNELLDNRWLKKHLLNPYLKTLQEQYGVQAYVYGCEHQTEGENAGQLHVHLFIDRFIDKAKLKGRWVALLTKNDLTAVYREKYGDDPYQSCHVKGIKSNSALQWYLQKYLIKKGQKEGNVTGHWWGASAWIKKCPLPTFEPSAGTIAKVADQRSGKKYRFTDIYCNPDTKEILCNEKGAAAPGAKKMMTVVKTVFDRERKTASDIKEILTAGDRAVYNLFIAAYRRCDWKWCQMAAADLGQILRNTETGVDFHWMDQQAIKDAKAHEFEDETKWMKYMREVKSKQVTGKKKWKRPPELGL